MKALIWARETPADMPGRQLSPAARHVLLLLASYSVVGGECWPAQTELAEKTGYSARHVKRLVRELERAGLVEVKRSHRKPNVYQLRAVDGADLAAGVLAADPEPVDDVPPPAPVEPIAPAEMTMKALSDRLWSSMDAAGEVDYRRAYEVTVPNAVTKYAGLKGLGTGATLLNLVVAHAADTYLGAPASEQARIARDRRLAALRKDHGVAILDALALAAQNANGDPLAYLTKVLKSGGVR